MDSTPTVSTSTSTTSSGPTSANSPQHRPLYSSRLGTDSKDSNSSTPRQTPAVQQKAWTGKNPITHKTNSVKHGSPIVSPTPLTPQQQKVQNNIDAFTEDQPVLIRLTSGAEFEGVFVGTSSVSCQLKKVQQKKLPGGIHNTHKREETTMTFQRKDVSSASAAKPRGPNGNQSGFRTDAAISNNRNGTDRTLKRWEPESHDGADLSLDGPSNSGPWDQFAENERRFGLKTDYDETIYTTAIDRAHPQYKQRMAEADRKAREIENTTAMTSHVAEERVMDNAGGEDKGGDEEDKYSGVRRQDFPPLSTGGANKYTPPARRAPTGQSSSRGVPVDPAIISSVIKGQGKKAGQAKAEDAANGKVSAAGGKVPSPAPESGKTSSKTDSKPEEAKSGEAAQGGDKTGTPVRSTGAASSSSKPTGGAGSPTATPPPKDGAPSAASTVERDVLNSFKTFATKERLTAAQLRQNKARHDKEVKLTELKKFANNFKLSTPVPNDLIGIIAKDPARQQEIQAKALQNAEYVMKSKKDTTDKDGGATKAVVPSKVVAPQPQTPAAVQNDVRTNPRAAPAPTGAAASSAGNSARHQTNNRQTFTPGGYHNQSFRNNQSGNHNLQQQNRQTGNLAQRLRNNMEATNKMNNNAANNTGSSNNHNQANHHHVQSAHMSVQDMRPPTGPASTMDFNGPRRISGAPGHISVKLNPNSHEFRPAGPPFAAAPFHGTSAQPSAGSSPRSSVNHMGDPASSQLSAAAANRGQLIRRKVQKVDVAKCHILAHIKTIKPTPPKNWDENDHLRPSWDTQPTWRQVRDDEKPDSTMLLNYKAYFEKQPFAGASMATPNPQHSFPHAHQYQLPPHLQQHGGHGMPPRQSPHMPPMQMHTGQHPHGGAPHASFNNGDDHRMVPSSSSQSFQSPRMTQVPMAYPPAMNSPAQMPYNQPTMPGFIGPGTPQMNQQYRNFQSGQYAMPGQPHMGPPMMMQPPFVGGPQGIPQMQMYPGGHPPQFMPASGAPSQPMPGSNGYPSPGRPAAPMMAPQGSQQGQPMYGMSPGMQYQQPAFPPQQPGQQGGNKYSKNGPPAQQQIRKY